MSSRWSIAKVVAVVSVAALAACTSTPESQASTALDDDAITVGSFDFEESALLAEMYSQALEGSGFVVDRRFEIGPRELVLPALSAGFIEFVPEYLGTALQFLSLGASEPGADTSSSHRSLDQTLRTGKLIALESSPAQDSNAFFVTRQTADREGLTELSDVATADDHLTFGGPAECPARPLCLVGLRETYGLSFRDVVALDAGGPLTRQALSDGSIDIALLFTTDPVIDTEGFVELRDDRGLQPPENVTPLVRAEVVDRWGTGFVDVVDAVSEHITTEELRELNGRVTRGEGDIASIARSWLAEQGLS
jgi:osmoprotectant transport system substrate-binding protein